MKVVKWVRAVPLKNPQVGKTPPLTLETGFFKILDPPPPQIRKVDRTPHPQIHFCPSDSQLRDFYGYLALKQCCSRDF